MTPESIVATGEVIADLGKRSAATLRTVSHELAVSLAWGLITWGIIGFEVHKWAISVGTYFILNAILGAVAGRNK